MDHLSQYLISLGSNLNQPRKQVLKAIELLAGFGAIVDRSSLFETSPIGPGKNNFCNAALILETKLKPLELLNCTQKIEQQLGRTQTELWGDRIIDLDIILWKQGEKGKSQIYENERLNIPHKQCHLRKFVLLPASEIAADWQHPILNKIINKLWSNLKNKCPEQMIKAIQTH